MVNQLLIGNTTITIDTIMVVIWLGYDIGINVLWVKIEGPVWYSIYHQLPDRGYDRGYHIYIYIWLEYYGNIMGNYSDDDRKPEGNYTQPIMVN